MKHKITNSLHLLIFSLCLFPIKNLAQQAFVIKPIIDLVCQKSEQESSEYYKNIPFCGGKPHMYSSCIRIHQLLFNETVEITEERGNEVCISITNLFYITEKGNEPQTKYWAHKDGFITVEQLEKKDLDLHKFPHPISFSENLEPRKQNIITLLFPWYDPITNQTFSAGTRFVKSEKPLTGNTTPIYVFDPKAESFKETKIPLSYTVTVNHMKGKKQKIKTFVRILRKWANLKHGFIPYTWGGCSFTAICSQNSFIKMESGGVKNSISYFERPDYQHDPKTGFDCSGLVARVAQICAIPYFFKNTTTLATYLHELEHGDTLREGDLIWIPGHVMVVSNVSKNMLIEARGYASGYGKVHELPLNTVLAPINTYKDLVKAYRNKEQLQLLNVKGQVTATINDIKLLKLESVWSQKSNFM